jgi:hypothetical protein
MRTSGDANSSVGNGTVPSFLRRRRQRQPHREAKRRSLTRALTSCFRTARSRRRIRPCPFSVPGHETGPEGTSLASIRCGLRPPVTVMGTQLSAGRFRQIIPLTRPFAQRLLHHGDTIRPVMQATLDFPSTVKTSQSLGAGYEGVRNDSAEISSCRGRRRNDVQPCEAAE